MARHISSTGQFHHYLPRFVLRRWQPTSLAGHKTKGKSRNRKRERINSYDRQSNTLGTTDLGKTFAWQAFSKLESDTANVFQILADAEERGCSSIELVRSQLNTIRKFLFLLFYRNGVHSRQFIENRFDPATEDVVKQYMERHGLADARAVWLRNLALLLEDEHWEVATDERLPTAVRQDYEREALHMQPGLYRAPPGTEFVLTENGPGLAEGATTPMNHIIDMMSPGAPGASFFPLTRSFPITPKLVIIMRSTAMTCETALLQAGSSNVSYFTAVFRTMRNREKNENAPRALDQRPEPRLD
ncbi:uncharacterized protein B0H18DRAFT_1119231 [Fomitopsis serialis]|uniref:uncharacterized protein n=1 Tax=Fomitopsis serialis TaxID=139415 RepID=UPI00200882BF|nr:uncharacterized protein B0H18DRAFT_1119231 [Neoantrodia serialis]KAH9925727.1 hypothetical protein B0H18DRAFT_1119231 [Neoantrodia serialis]